jgi:hypothetical protein
MRLGFEKTAMIRPRAGVSFALTEAMDEGHCGLPTEELIPRAAGRQRGPTPTSPPLLLFNRQATARPFFLAA